MFPWKYAASLYLPKIILFRPITPGTGVTLVFRVNDRGKGVEVETKREAPRWFGKRLEGCRRKKNTIKSSIKLVDGPWGNYMPKACLKSSRRFSSAPSSQLYSSSQKYTNTCFWKYIILRCIYISNRFRILLIQCWYSYLVTLLVEVQNVLYNRYNVYVYYVKRFEVSLTFSTNISITLYSRCNLYIWILHKTFRIFINSIKKETRV